MLADMTGQHSLLGLAAFLGGIPFFAALDETARIQLAGQFEPVRAADGEVIITEGEAGDGLFVVVSGRLRVSVTARGAERVLHDLGRGSIVGEIALLSNRPRSATVRAVRDSDLLLLRVAAFRSLVERNPEVLGEMARLLVDRLLAVDRPREPLAVGRAITVAAAGTSAGAATLVAERLTVQLSRAGPVFFVNADVVARHLGSGAAQRGPNDPGRAELTGWLHAVERSNDYVLYQADAEDTAWSRLCISQSDVALLVAAASEDPSPGPVETGRLQPARCGASWCWCIRARERRRPDGSRTEPWRTFTTCAPGGRRMWRGSHGWSPAGAAVWCWVVVARVVLPTLASCGRWKKLACPSTSLAAPASARS